MPGRAGQRIPAWGAVAFSILGDGVGHETLRSGCQ